MTAMKREEELTVSVKIKPLIWDQYGAETPFGWYEITDQRDAVNPSELRRRMPFLLCASRTKYTRHETFEAAQAAAQADFEARIRSVLISNPKPEPVGWETDAEWDLEMRCCNITEATPFAEVSKLINDLWQQYCLAAEPKPEASVTAEQCLEICDRIANEDGADISDWDRARRETAEVIAQSIRQLIAEPEATEGVDRQVHHSKPVSAPLQRETAETWKQVVGLFRKHGLSEPPFRLRDELVIAFEWAWFGYRAALTAKQTDGREGE